MSCLIFFNDKLYYLVIFYHLHSHLIHAPPSTRNRLSEIYASHLVLTALGSRRLIFVKHAMPRSVALSGDSSFVSHLIHAYFSTCTGTSKLITSKAVNKDPLPLLDAFSHVVPFKVRGIPWPHPLADPSSDKLRCLNFLSPYGVLPSWVPAFQLQVHFNCTFRRTLSPSRKALPHTLLSLYRATRGRYVTNFTLAYSLFTSKKVYAELFVIGL